MADEVYFTGTTKKELKAFLAAGVDAKGRKIRVWLFNWRGLKTVHDLWMEHTENDIKLVRRTDGRIVRYAWNVKVHIETPTRKLCEVRREYARNMVLWWCFWWVLWLSTKARVLVRKQKFAVSETRKRDETPEQAAQRGVWEELHIEIPLDELRPLTLPAPVPQGDPTRESRVYADLLSLNHTEHFVWLKKDSFWESEDSLREISRNGIIIPDHNVLIYLEWFDKKTAPPTGDGLRKTMVEALENSTVTDREIFAFLQGGEKRFLNGTLRGPVLFTPTPDSPASPQPQASSPLCSS